MGNCARKLGLDVAIWAILIALMSLAVPASASQTHTHHGAHTVHTVHAIQVAQRTHSATHTNTSDKIDALHHGPERYSSMAAHARHGNDRAVADDGAYPPSLAQPGHAHHQPGTCHSTLSSAASQLHDCCGSDGLLCVQPAFVRPRKQDSGWLFLYVQKHWPLLPPQVLLPTRGALDPLPDRSATPAPPATGWRAIILDVSLRLLN